MLTLRVIYSNFEKIIFSQNDPLAHLSHFWPNWAKMNQDWPKYERIIFIRNGNTWMLWQPSNGECYLVCLRRQRRVRAAGPRTRCVPKGPGADQAEARRAGGRFLPSKRYNVKVIFTTFMSNRIVVNVNAMFSRVLCGNAMFFFRDSLIIDLNVYFCV